MVNHTGEYFGGYHLKRLLSDRGTFANVYEGEHLFEGAQAAIKAWKVQIEVKIFLNDVRATILIHPHNHVDFGLWSQGGYSLSGDGVCSLWLSSGATTFISIG